MLIIGLLPCESSQPCSTLELAVTCRCAWACLITFEPGIFANVSAALRAAAERPIRVSRLSSASVSLRTSEPLRTFADSALGDVTMASALSCRDLISHFWREHRFIARWMNRSCSSCGKSRAACLAAGRIPIATAAALRPGQSISSLLTHRNIIADCVFRESIHAKFVLAYNPRFPYDLARYRCLRTTGLAQAGQPGPAVISRIGSKLEITSMNTLFVA